MTGSLLKHTHILIVTLALTTGLAGNTSAAENDMLLPLDEEMRMVQQQGIIQQKTLHDGLFRLLSEEEWARYSRRPNAFTSSTNILFQNKIYTDPAQLPEVHFKTTPSQRTKKTVSKTTASTQPVQTISPSILAPYSGTAPSVAPKQDLQQTQPSNTSQTTVPTANTGFTPTTQASQLTPTSPPSSPATPQNNNIIAGAPRSLIVPEAGITLEPNNGRGSLIISNPEE